MRKHIWGVPVILILLSALTAAAAIGAETTGQPAAKLDQALSRVPDSAFVVVAAKSLGEGESALAEFVDAVQPGAGGMLRETIHRGLDAYGQGAGIDSSSPLVVLAVPTGPQKVAELSYVPMSDMKAWREYWKDSIGKQQPSGVEYFEKYPGRPMYFKEAGPYLVMSDDASALKLENATGTTLSSARADGLKALLKENVVAVNFSMPALLKAYPDLPDKFAKALANIQAPPGIDSSGMGEMMTTVYGQPARDIFEGLDQAYLSLHPNAEALAAALKMTTIKGTTLSKVFSEQGKIDLSDMSLMPAGSFVVFAIGLRGDTVWQNINDITARMAKSYAATPEKAQAVTATISKAIAEMKSYGVTDNVTFAMVKGDGESAMMGEGIYRTKQPVKVIDVATGLMSNPDVVSMMEKLSASSGMPIAKVTISDETIDNTPVKVFDRQLDTTATPPMMRQMAKMMQGFLVTRLAAKDDRLYAATGKSPAGMGDILSAKKGAPGRMDEAKIQKSMDGIGKDLSGLVLVSLPDYMAWAMSFALPGAANAAAPEIPATSRFTAAGVRFDGSTAEAKLYVPTEQIRAASAVVQQTMMRARPTEQPRSGGLESTGAAQ